MIVILNLMWTEDQNQYANGFCQLQSLCFNFECWLSLLFSAFLCQVNAGLNNDHKEAAEHTCTHMKEFDKGLDIITVEQ